MSLNVTELRELLGAINETDITEFTLKGENFELTVKRGQSAVVTSGQLLPPVPPLPAPIAPAPPAEPAPARPPAAPPLVDKKLVDVTSPMVGTFYRAPSPNDAPFVETGDRIRQGQAVCIIEAMKLMNELEAEVSGEIVEILVQNAEPVEYGQVLMRVNPG